MRIRQPDRQAKFQAFLRAGAILRRVAMFWPVAALAMVFSMDDPLGPNGMILMAPLLLLGWDGIAFLRGRGWRRRAEALGLALFASMIFVAMTPDPSRWTVYAGAVCCALAAMLAAWERERMRAAAA